MSYKVNKPDAPEHLRCTKYLCSTALKLRKYLSNLHKTKAVFNV